MEAEKIIPPKHQKLSSHLTKMWFIASFIYRLFFPPFLVLGMNTWFSSCSECFLLIPGLSSSFIVVSEELNNIYKLFGIVHGTLVSTHRCWCQYQHTGCFVFLYCRCRARLHCSSSVRRGRVWVSISWASHRIPASDWTHTADGHSISQTLVSHDKAKSTISRGRMDIEST